MAQAGQRVSEYILEDRLGAGTFGEVWLARHHVWSEQLVAIKIPTEPEYIRNLQRESAAVHGLAHPNIVRAIGFDPYADPPYLVMEYTPGTSLRPLIQSKALSVADSILIIRQILTGLLHAHRNNIIHRDIKPENILVHERSKTEGYGAEGVIKITDFGLGKAANIVGKQSIAYSLSINDDRARQITGTINYMSPEQREGEDLDARSDLYACGVVLFEMLTGSRPVGADVPSDLVPDLPKYFDEMFKRSCARLEKRYRTTRQFLNALPNPTKETPEEQSGSTSTPPAVVITDRSTTAQGDVPDSQPIPKPPSQRNRLRDSVKYIARLTIALVIAAFFKWCLWGNNPKPIGASPTKTPPVLSVPQAPIMSNDDFNRHIAKTTPKSGATPIATSPTGHNGHTVNQHIGQTQTTGMNVDEYVDYLIQQQRQEKAGASTYTSTNGFTLQIPPGWVRMPDEELQRAYAKLKKPGAINNIQWEAGFQPQGNPYFTYPYLLVMTSKIPREATNSEMKQLISDFTGISSANLEKALSNQARGLVSGYQGQSVKVDVEAGTFDARFSAQVTGDGTVQGWITGHFGHNALVQVVGYDHADTFAQNEPSFRAVADSFQFADWAKRQGAIIPAWLTHRVGQSALAGALLGVIGVILNKWKPKKVKAATGVQNTGSSGTTAAVHTPPATSWPSRSDPVVVSTPMGPTTDATPDAFPPWWRYCSLHAIGYHIGWSWIASAAGAIILVSLVDPSVPQLNLAKPLDFGVLIGKLIVGFIFCFAFGLIGSYRTWRIMRKSEDWSFIGWVMGVMAIIALITAGLRT